MTTRPRTATLVPMLLLGAATLAAAGCELALTDLRAQSKDEWTRTYDLAPDGDVQIENANGEIDVQPSTDGKLHVRAERTAKAGTEAAARELLAKITIEEQASADRVRLETRGPKGGLLSGGSYSVQYFVSAPAGARLKVQNTNGRVAVTGMSGPVDARTTNGGVRASGLKGPVHASTTNGGVDVDVDAVHPDGIRLETTNGGVRLTVPESACADSLAEVTNGGISTGSLQVERVGESSRRRLEGRLNGGGARIHLETTNGGVHLSGKGAS